MNSIGRIFRLTDYGESHGKALGGVIDGVPAGFKLDLTEIQTKVNQRRPGRSLVSRRNEPDQVEWLSGLSEEGVTLGTPVSFIVRNRDARSDDYSEWQEKLRPGHADYTTLVRYGIREYRGGGRASARQTLCRVVAGGMALQFLRSLNIELRTFISGIGDCIMQSPYTMFPSEQDIIASPVFCPEKKLSGIMEALLVKEIIGSDSIGGRVSLICRGMPAGIGSPVYDKLNARLAAAIMSINAARGIEFGQGMVSSTLRGCDAIDTYVKVSDSGERLNLRSEKNRAGGIEGGMTTGDDICLSVAFKPTPSRPYPVKSFDTSGNNIEITPGGRHDPCVAIRAVPVVESMAAIIFLDELLIARTAQW